MIQTKTPKILPWVARKAGISDVQAEALWREAVRRATLQIGRTGNAAYYRAVMERLHELVDQAKADALARQPVSPSRPLRHRPTVGSQTGGDPVAFHWYYSARNKLLGKRRTVAAAICNRQAKCARILD